MKEEKVGEEVKEEKLDHDGEVAANGGGAAVGKGRKRAAAADLF